jgi:hypothetical protein
MTAHFHRVTRVSQVHPMLLSLFFDCPSDFPHLQPNDFPSSKPFATMTSPKPLLCPNTSQAAAVKQAIADGVIVFDAFPVSAEPEIYSAGVFTAGLDLVSICRMAYICTQRVTQAWY